MLKVFLFRIMSLLIKIMVSLYSFSRQMITMRFLGRLLSLLNLMNLKLFNRMGLDIMILKNSYFVKSIGGIMLLLLIVLSSPIQVSASQFNFDGFYKESTERLFSQNKRYVCNQVILNEFRISGEEVQQSGDGTIVKLYNYSDFIHVVFSTVVLTTNEIWGDGLANYFSCNSDVTIYNFNLPEINYITLSGVPEGVNIGNTNLYYTGHIGGQTMMIPEHGERTRVVMPGLYHQALIVRVNLEFDISMSSLNSVMPSFTLTTKIPAVGLNVITDVYRVYPIGESSDFLFVLSKMGMALNQIALSATNDNSQLMQSINSGLGNLGDRVTSSIGSMQNDMNTNWNQGSDYVPPSGDLNWADGKYISQLTSIADYENKESAVATPALNVIQNFSFGAVNFLPNMQFALSAFRDIFMVFYNGLEPIVLILTVALLLFAGTRIVGGLRK